MRIVLLLLAFLLDGCSETGERFRLALVPPAIMDELGQVAFAEMKQSLPRLEGRQADLVQCIAEHLLRVSESRFPPDRLPQSWEVMVFDDPAANAFALPGGRIGVFSGLLAVAENDDQLAAVIGHEIGHLLAQHGNERLTQQLGVSAVLLIVGLFTDIENRLLLQALGLGAHYGVTLPFSRAHEVEADLTGLVLMAEAGFDPRQSVRLWENMARQASAQPPEFMSTHPGHETRIARLGQQMDVAVTRYDSAPRSRCE